MAARRQEQQFNTMLRQRIITAAILVAFVLLAFYFLPPEGLFVLLLGVSVIAAYEWSKLSGLRSWTSTGLFVVVLISAVGILVTNSQFAVPIQLFGVFLWICLAALLIKSKAMSLSPVFQRIIGIAILVLAVFSISNLYISVDSPGKWLAGLILIVATADMAAYFSGKRFGKTKLAPRISPGKTVEGVKGSFFAVFALGLVTGTLVWQDDYSEILIWTGVCLLTACFCVFGDLFVSAQKRIAGQKDSGKLLPGHGGALDRIDSILAAAPFYSLCVQFLMID